jgi:hypothetical protein
MFEIDKEQEVLLKEEQCHEKKDSAGNTWRKVYFGGSSHFKNWLDQVIELRGEENVQVEEVEAKGLQCFDMAGEKIYRIWVRETGDVKDFT